MTSIHGWKTAKAGERRWSRPVAAAVSFAGTIRGRILIAFLIMSAITGILGLSAASGIRRADELVSRTFDQSLMSINYARAAAADFANMRSLEARRRMSTDPVAKGELESRLDSLRRVFAEDLAVAVERAQSGRATQAAQAVERAVKDWDAARSVLAGRESTDADWDAVDRHAGAVEEHLDLFINHTAGDGFIYRQQARAVVARETQINLFGTLLALLMSASVAFLLARRIIRPVADASMVASRIAAGDLSVTIPSGSADELGALLASMGVMRDNIRRAMEQEVAQRISAEAHLADALETSLEGIVVVDESGRIALINGQAEDFLGFGREPVPRDMSMARVAVEGNALARTLLSEDDDWTTPRETQLSDGRWLRISRSRTRSGGFIAVCSDITLLKVQKARLQSTNLRLDTALDNMSQGLCLFDAEGHLTVVNRRYCELFDLAPEDLPLGTPYEDVAALYLASAEEGTVFEIEGRQISAAGSGFRQMGNGRVLAVTHKPVAGGGMVSTYEDVTDRRQADARIAFMARHDVLTGLPNRAMFGERIEEALAHLGRGGMFAVLCLDLDRFKEVNDTLGHPVGDELLKAVGNRLTACLREVDTVARLGGDEFAIILAGVTYPEEATILARRIVDVVSNTYELDGQQVAVGVSIGICLAPGDGTSCDKLLKNADVALYRAKADGRGTWRFFEVEMDIRLQARRALELDLREAVAEGAFEMFYQPIYDFRGRRVCGFEALMRWRHPERGLVSPAEFITVAEEIGLIVPLGDWALRTACIEAMRWPDGIRVAVNVSVAQFRDGIVIQSVKDALSASRLPAARLELEITESVLLKDNAATLATLHALRRLGVRIAMDDFGTGYSSLSYLRSFPFDKIKIDQSFVRDITAADESAFIVRAVIGLGLSLNMRTTGEGIETEIQFERLRQEGCDEGQGYYIGRPEGAGSIPEVLDRWSGRRGLAKHAVA